MATKFAYFGIEHKQTSQANYQELFHLQGRKIT